MTKRNHDNRSAEKTVRDIRRATRRQLFQQKKKSVSSWMVFAVKTASQNCAAVKASTPTCTTAGARSFSKPVRNDLPAILPVKLPRMK